MIGRRAELIGAVLAVAWLVTFVALDLAFRGPDVVFVGLFGVAPLIAAAVLSPGVTAGMWMLATAVAVWAGTWDHIFATPNHWVRVGNVAVVGAVSFAVATVRVRREERLRRVEAIAEAAQRAILPAVPQQLDALRIAVRYRSANREAQVGGDLYDVMRRGSTTRLIIGDVRGKGLPAVQHAARVIRMFRQSAEQADLAAAAGEISRAITPLLGDEDFVTALLVEYDVERLRLVNCGHHPPLLAVDGQAGQLALADSGLPLGLADGFVACDVAFPVGARLLLFTDGLVEARDRAGRFLPMDRVVAALRAPTPETVLDALLATVQAHVGRAALGDDLALLLVERAS